MSNHVGEERVTGNVEWHSKTLQEESIEKTVTVGDLEQDRHTFMIIYHIEGNFGNLVKLVKMKTHQYRLSYATVKRLDIEILDLVEEIQQADSFN